MELVVDSKLFGNMSPSIGIIRRSQANFSTSRKSLFFKADAANGSKVLLFSRIESVLGQTFSKDASSP